MRLYEYFRHYFVYKVHFCKKAKNGLPPPKRKKPFCVLCLRSFIFFTIVLLTVVLSILSTAHKKDFAEMVPKLAHEFLNYEEKQHAPFILSDLKIMIEKRNRKQTIEYNINLPYQEYSTVFVIFVKGFKLQLKYLLASLSSVRDIGKALIVFSHSVYDENVNNIIMSIDFCSYIQIYYPYSLQLYPDKFPDFLSKMGTDKSEEKHHWWWTMNQVFERLFFSSYYDGLVVFLKDDVFFLKDFLYMLQIMDQAGKSLKKCDMFSLATREPRFYQNYHNGVEVMSWNPKYHADVLAFNSVTWNQIVFHYDKFCSIDDNDWMRSLLHVSMETNSAFNVMSSVLPRAYKINYDGVLEELVVFESVYTVLKIQRDYNKYLFPTLLDIYDHVELIDPEFDEDFKQDLKGGWNDPRDINLCLNMTAWKIKKILFQSACAFLDYIPVIHVE